MRHAKPARHARLARIANAMHLMKKPQSVPQSEPQRKGMRAGAGAAANGSGNLANPSHAKKRRPRQRLRPYKPELFETIFSKIFFLVTFQFH